MSHPKPLASKIDSNSIARLGGRFVPLVGLGEWRCSVLHYTTSMPFARVGRMSLRVTMSALGLRGLQSGSEFEKLHNRLETLLHLGTGSDFAHYRSS